MTKLRHLKASAFRGARFDLPLDFSKENRSVAIFGENAAGKSTITDALEWFLYDRVDHLWREDCKQDSLRHVLTDDADASVVEIQFDGKDQHGTKSLSVDLKTTTSYANDNAGSLVSELKGDNIILRHADIVNFLDRAKGSKREAIAKIIGYEEITQFRSVIQQARNSLQKEGAYTTAKQQSQTLQSNMVEATGQIVPDRAAFLEIAKSVVEPFGLKTSITDEKSYEDALKELRGHGSSADKIKAAERLGQLEKACDALKRDIDQLLKGAEAFAGGFNALAKERENVNQLRLSDFLAKGKAVIDEEIFTDEQCPFCLSPYDLSDLQSEVAKRLAEMAELQTKLEATKALKDTLIESVNSTGLKAKALVADHADLDGFSELIDCAKAALGMLRDYHKAITSAFAAIEIFEPPNDFSGTITDLRVKCEASHTKARESANKLDLTDLEKQVAEALTKLQTLSQQVDAYEKCRGVISAYEAQIITLSTIFDEFILVQNAALQAVLDKISDDVGIFYRKLHPKEAVDNVRLAMVGEEGVEFEYSFHGKATQPPRKYLSESHLNSLGIVLFLANARIFNKKAKFLVLDDIVTSFDTNHRRRLLRLLRDEFSDWQIIILTHENIWFDLIKKEMDHKSWRFREVYADDDNGILVDESPATLTAIIEKKKGKEDVTNDLRKLLEAVLKEISSALEVKVSFRFNETNEKRMPDELLGRLRATLNEKSPELAKNKLFSDLAGSTLIANLDSHDNPGKITGGDIDVLLEDIEKLSSLFICADCNRPVRADIPVAGAKEVSCKCGKAKISWKR
ncbi:hypothetical protein B7H23_07715 [Notoacmeibacter marinus]|uniref:RecF/RecN/SMC N-terminal domain-containing protein n=1 Tax=Notoacmeibacter marinus TaxID=1876515 RepID=A0A231V3J0_9HYPH|nr:AAA family ATPase [Notoacmeibacter marinus]OXT02749.1 hypothetical protein B7H23_07715 [Notoacmeibacter marinus]